ncbi:DNA-binding response regulator [Salmonella enterica subsp. enterica serovar Java]|nr:DNA-binding response regulator [Salmonella enterica subsp. enterica serovar Java]
MTIIVSAFSPTPDLVRTIGQATDGDKVDVCEHPSLQDFTTALYSDPDHVGVFWSPGPATAAETIRRMRMADVKSPIFALLDEAKSQTEIIRGRVMVLAAGGDDVQPWPIDPRELRARLLALHRRKRNLEPDTHILPGGTFNVPNGWVVGANGTIQLTRQEATLFAQFLHRRGSVTTKDLCMVAMYGDVGDPAKAKIIDVFVCKLRKKLLAATGHNPIETIWGVGFRVSPMTMGGLPL